MHLALTISVKQALTHEFVRAGHDEYCGLVVGPVLAVGDAIVPLRNVALDRTRGFAFDDVEHAMARRAIRQRGHHVVAIYHSHPRTPPSPSAFDERALHVDGQPLFPDDAVLIVGREDTAPDPVIAAYRFDVAVRRLAVCAISWVPVVGHVGNARSA